MTIGRWWGKPLFRPNFVYEKTPSLPIFPQFGNHVTTNWCFQRSTRFGHTGFEIFSVPGHLRCYIGAIFLCNSVLRTFHAQIFQTNQHNQWVFSIVRDKIQKGIASLALTSNSFSVFVYQIVRCSNHSCSSTCYFEIKSQDRDLSSLSHHYDLVTYAIPDPVSVLLKYGWWKKSG